MLYIGFFTKMKYVINNKLWFNNYLQFRRSILLIIFFAILCFIKPDLVPEDFAQWVQIIAISLLLTLLIFDYLQKPSFFELQQIENGLRIGLYIPDTRYFIYFSAYKIRYFDINSQERVLLKIISNHSSFLREGMIEVVNKNGGIILFQPINLTWANQEQLTLILKIIEEHNKKLYD